MDAPGETSRVNGENVTKDILKDLIKYRASPKSHPPDFPLKVTMRKISEKIKIEMDVKDPFKPEDLLTNVQALEGVIHALYLHAETEEQPPSLYRLPVYLRSWNVQECTGRIARSDSR